MMDHKQLIFQPIYKTITIFSVLTSTVSEWGSKRFLNEKFKTPYTSNKSFSPKLIWNNFRIILKLQGSCLKQENKATFISNNAINLFIVFELERWSRDLNTDFFLKDCLFGAVKITKNADPDKYVYIVYGTGFKSCSEFSLPDCSMDKNDIIFGVDMRSSVHTDDNSWYWSNTRIR